MAERARTLRQRLSKKAIEKKTTIQEETKEQKENVVVPEVINEVNEDQQLFEPLTVQPLSKNKTVSHFDVDPLNFLEQVDVIEEEKPIDPLEFLENKHTEKKKKIEGEEEEKEGEGKNIETTAGEKEGKEKKKKPRKSRVAKIRLLLDKIKQKKAENPNKLLGKLSQHNEEKLIHQIVKDAKKKGQDGATSPIETEESRKQKLMSRMLTGKQSFSKKAFGRALFKLTGNADINDDNKEAMEAIKKINTDYVLQDKDVKQVKEETATGENKKKDVDISIFMTPNNQKPKRSIADMILGRNKQGKKEKN